MRDIWAKQRFRRMARSSRHLSTPEFYETFGRALGGDMYHANMMLRWSRHRGGLMHDDKPNKCSCNFCQPKETP